MNMNVNVYEHASAEYFKAAARYLEHWSAIHGQSHAIQRQHQIGYSRERELMREIWMKNNGMKESKRRGVSGLFGLPTAYGRDNINFPDCDHGEMFQNERGHVWVTQPYLAASSSYSPAFISEFEEAVGVRRTTHTLPAWHFPGAAVLHMWEPTITKEEFKERRKLIPDRIRYHTKARRRDRT